jgi:hypothetical protein
MQCIEDLRAVSLPGTASWRVALQQVLGGILKFPDPRPAENRNPAVHDDNDDYRRTSYHPRTAYTLFLEGKPLAPIWVGRLWKAFDAFAKSSAGQTKKGEKNVGLFLMLWRWLGVCFPQDPLPAATASGETGTFARHYGWVKDRAASSGMSGVYGDAHRGGIIASYLLAAFAVLLAVAGGICHHHHDKFPEWSTVVAAALEILVIVLLFALAVCSRAENWKKAYTDSRILAESLRMMEHLGPLGVHTPLPRLPHFLRGGTNSPAPESLWSVWYFRALVRNAPLRLNGTPDSSAADFHGSLVENWIEKQILHHRGNTTKQASLHHGVEKLSNLLFGVVFLAAVVHLLDAIVGWHFMFAISLVICVGAPALIAALHGFSSQIEIARLHQRSASMEKILMERKSSIDELDLTGNPVGAEAVWGLATEALAAAAMMMDETAEWSLLYRNTDIHG